MCVNAAHLEFPTVTSNTPHQKQNNHDEQNCTNYTNTAAPKAVSVSAEAAGKATQQKDDENDDEYESSDMIYLLIAALAERRGFGSTHTAGRARQQPFYLVSTVAPSLPTSICIPEVCWSRYHW